jgi:uncharacterized protein YjbJ (UPF0337 family)
MDPDDTRDRSRFHELKGSVKRALGWLTADRRVEAEGQAEERLAAPPTDEQADREEHRVKRDYGETMDAPGSPAELR